MAITKYQKFETININREDIKNAPYNPRTISDAAKRKLKANIKKNGLLSTLVVNSRTMNLVSGHQRLAILDSLERNQKYQLTVSLVSLSETEEKEQNIFFNNAQAQGQFDIDLLANLMIDIDFVEAGFEASEMALLGVEVDLTEDINTKGLKKVSEEEEATTPVAFNNEIFQTAREKRKAIIAQSQGNNKEDIDCFVVLTFSSPKNKSEFLERFDFDKSEKYLKGEYFGAMIERID